MLGPAERWPLLARLPAIGQVWLAGAPLPRPVPPADMPQLATQQQQQQLLCGAPPLRGLRGPLADPCHASQTAR